ncbi:hypothetical protein B9J07_27960 [Sinorhizobium sp. LM21]|uniref:hypothetical protein n=1 Tax=Sinorhizobium sp. LM21 TaxID=1449788 RepID=UPI0005D8664B|nr:hypothetical protein [Sinorhizobium sp. LM21]AJW30172.1 hypothetical protein pLM21S1_p52 [Sinorhizobium sp. LM21]OWZ90425.1 hypothetical protein B9J07_27960 [Sinorhizobium sp. LM21]
MTHMDLAEAYIHSTGGSYTAGSLSYTDNWAHSWNIAIARKVKVGRQTVLLINSMPYSVSTSAHRGSIRRAAKAAGLRTFEVPNLHIDQSHELNLRVYRARIADLENRRRTAHKPAKYDQLIQELQREMSDYIDLFEPEQLKEAA